MAQNSGISSRKQELLSRLKNTLAIVSQATGFDRLNEDRHTADHRDVDLRQIDPRSVDRRHIDLSRVDPVTRSGEHRQMDMNPLDPRTYRPVSNSQKDDDLVRWSGQRDSDMRLPDRSQQMRIDDNDDMDIYRRTQFAGPAKPCHNSSSIGEPVARSSFGEPVARSSFEKFAEIEDEDEFLYGKEDATPKASSTSHATGEARWHATGDSSYHTSSSQSSTGFSSGYMRASNRSPLPHEFANTVRDREVARSSTISSQSQQPFGYSNSFHMASDSLYTADVAPMPQQPTRAPVSSKSDGLSVLGNVNTDMLQNILKLVSLQKPSQSHQGHGISGVPEWSHETASPPQNTSTPNIGISGQRTLAPSYNPLVNEHIQSSRATHRASPDVIQHQTSVYQKSESGINTQPTTNLASMRSRGNDEHHQTMHHVTKEQDLESRPPEMISAMKMSAMVSEAATDTGNRMSELLSAVESETSNKMSALLSNVADDAYSNASEVEKSESKVKDEVFDRLITMLGCNSNIKSIMQQLIKKEKADSEMSKKFNVDLHVTDQKKASNQIPNYTQFETAKKEEHVKQDASLVRPEMREDTRVKVKSPIPSENVPFESDISEEDDNKSTVSIPIVSSLDRLQKNYDSDADHKPQSTALQGRGNQHVIDAPDNATGDRMKVIDKETSQVSARDSEWEKSTAEFLRRLQTKKSVVASREKSRSPRRVSRDRPRSPGTRSRDKSLSPQGRSKDRSQSPKLLAKKPESGRSVSPRTSVKKPVGSKSKDRSPSPRLTMKSLPPRSNDRPESPRASVKQLAPPKDRKKSPKTVVTKSDDVRGKDIGGMNKQVGENKKEASLVQKVAEPVQADKSSPVSISDDDRSQLLKAKEELTSTVVLLMSELEKLRVERSALALKADGRYRNEELKKNIALQEEMGEHICSLKKALNELDCQLDKANLAQMTSTPPSKSEVTEQKLSDKSKKDVSVKCVPKNVKKGVSRSRSTSSSSSSHSSSSTSSSSRSRSRSGKRSSGKNYYRRNRSKDRYKKRRADSKRKGSVRGLSKQDTAMGKNNSKNIIGKKEVQLSPAVKPLTVENQKQDLKESARDTTKTLESNSVATSCTVVNQSEETVQTVASGSVDRGGLSTFSRENLISSLQQMVKSTEDGTSSVKEKNEPIGSAMKEKQTSALELAIAMYLAANEFYDGGNLWCRLCDGIYDDISGLCRHIHSDQHQLKLDPTYNQLKHSGVMHKPSCSDGSFVAPARGDEFLMPIQSFFCSLCCEYSKDSTSAETHLKSRAHNTKFKSFLKDNPTYEMQFLRGKMFAVQNVGEIQKDDTQPKKEEQTNFEQIDNRDIVDHQQSPAKPQVSDISKRKFDESQPEADVKRVKIERKITNDVFKIERKIAVETDKVKVTQEIDTDTRKVILIKETEDEDEEESKKMDSSKESSVKKNSRSWPDKQEKSPKADQHRSPEKYRERVESRMWEKRDTSDRWRGHREERNDDRKWKSSQSVGRRESPYQSQEDRKRGASSKANEEKAKVSSGNQRGRDTESSKSGDSKETTNRGFSSVSISPTNIPLPEKPLSKTFEPFTLGRGAKLTRQPLKKPGASSSREAGRSGASANFNFQDFEVLDECGDA